MQQRTPQISKTERALALTAAAFPLALALVFVPQLEAPFSAAKNAVFVSGAAVLFSMSLLAGRTRRRWPSLLPLALAAFVSVTLVSAAFSPYRHMSLHGVVWIISGALLLVAMSRVRAEHLSWIIHGVAVSGTAVAIITLAQHFLRVDLFALFGHESPTSGRMRLYSTLGNPDFVGTYLAAALPAVLVSSRRGFWRTVQVATAITICAAVIVTGSRAGLLALAVAAVVFFAVAHRVSRRTMIVGAIAVCLVLAGTFARRFNARSLGETLRGRTMIWHVTLAEHNASWLVGSGPNTFAYLYPERLGRFLAEASRASLMRFAGHERHAQNDFLEMLSENGVLGVAAFGALLLAWLLWMFRKLPSATESSRAGEFAAALAGIAAVSTAGLFDFPLHRAETWALFSVWFAVPLTLALEDTANTDKRIQSVRLGLTVRAVAAVVVCAVAIPIALRPAVASYWIGTAERHEDAGQIEAAEKALYDALALEPASPTAQFDLTRVLAKQDRFEAALEQSRLAVRFVNEPELYILRSRICMALSDPERARAELQRATELFPYSDELSDELAFITARP